MRQTMFTVIALLGVLVTAAAAAQDAKPVKGQGCVATGVEASCLVVKDVKTGVLYNLSFKGDEARGRHGNRIHRCSERQDDDLHAGQATRSVQLVTRGCAQVPIKPGGEAVDPDRATAAHKGTAPGFPLAALRVSYQIRGLGSGPGDHHCPKSGAASSRHESNCQGSNESSPRRNARAHLSRRCSAPAAP